MPERTKSISEARQSLPGLSQTAQKRLDRYIITHQGQPQSVLIGYNEYLGMKAAVDLLHRPEDLKSIQTGLAQIEAGHGLTAGEARNRLRARTGAARSHALASELAAKSGVDARTINVVIDAMVDKAVADLRASGTIDIPGLGTFTIEDVPENRAGRRKRDLRKRRQTAFEPASRVREIMFEASNE